MWYAYIWYAYVWQNHDRIKKFVRRIITFYFEVTLTKNNLLINFNLKERRVKLAQINLKMNAQKASSAISFSLIIF